MYITNMNGSRIAAEVEKILDRERKDHPLSEETVAQYVILERDLTAYLIRLREDIDLQVRA